MIIDKSNEKRKNKKRANDEILLEKIDVLEVAQNLMWEKPNNEKDPYKRTVILEKIKELQPSIWTTYYKIRKQLFEIPK